MKTILFIEITGNDTLVNYRFMDDEIGKRISNDIIQTELDELRDALYVYAAPEHLEHIKYQNECEFYKERIWFIKTDDDRFPKEIETLDDVAQMKIYLFGEKIKTLL